MDLNIIAAPDAAPSAPAGRGWVRDRLPGGLGDCATDRIWPEPGLLVALTRYRPGADLIEESDRRGSGAAFTVTLCLEGASAYRSEGGGLVFREAAMVACAARGLRGRRRFRGGAALTQVRVSVRQEVLARYVDEDVCADWLAPTGLRPLLDVPLSGVARDHARALACQAGHEAPDMLELHGRALAVLALALRPLLARQDTGAAAARAEAHARKAQQALAMLEDAIDRPLDVDALAARLGLGTTRLRALCQRHWGASPQRQLHALRMRHAHGLLEGGLPVASVARRVGYAHPANFSTAFGRYYGYPPGRLLRAGQAAP